MGKSDHKKNLRPPWKKGQTGNPKGRPPDALNAALKKLTKEELEDIANLIIKGNMPALRAIAKDDTAPVIKVMVAATVVKIISKGDMHSLDTLLNRLVGKVKDTIHHTGTVGATTVVLKIPDNGRSAK